MAELQINKGWLQQVTKHPSPHFSAKQDITDVSLLVVHNISLPAGQFGLPYITDLFLGRLDTSADPSFASLEGLRVSAHCLIRRDGEIIQYVSFFDKAWHAGVSTWQGRDKCNDYAIGIELEGTDIEPYTDMQYRQLAKITKALQVQFPNITDDRIVGHCDIAPERKTDPGLAFNWSTFYQCLAH